MSKILLTPRVRRVALVCPHSILVSVTINYTNIVATSHMKPCFLKSKVNFSWLWILSWRKNSALSAFFKRINQLTRATSKGEVGKPPMSFFKIDKKHFDFGKNCLLYVHIWVKSSFEMQFQEYLENKTQKLFPPESFFCMSDMKCLSKWLYFKKSVLPPIILGCAAVSTIPD